METYKELEIEVIVFDSEDVITGSCTGYSCSTHGDITTPEVCIDKM